MTVNYKIHVHFIFKFTILLEIIVSSWVDWLPSFLHHLQSNENCLVRRLSCRQCQWFHDMAAKFPSRMSLMNNHLWTEFLLRHCPANDAILYIRCELLSRVIQSTQISGNHSGIDSKRYINDTWRISNWNVLLYNRWNPFDYRNKAPKRPSLGQ